MTLTEIEHHLISLPNVTTATNFGYRFFSYATDHVTPFATLADSDSDYDNVSNLNREGIYRLNIGLTRDTFKALFPDPQQPWDHAELNRIMPHPVYAAQHFVCVLNPAGPILAQTLQHIAEAHALAKQRFDKKHLP